MQKLLLASLITTIASPVFAQQNPITLYVSDDIITLSDSEQQKPTAIAVQNGHILDVGQQTELTAKYQNQAGFTIDRSFEHKTITPGFVEPHIHLWLMGILTSTEFITPADWQLPWGNVEGVVGEKAYLERLKQIEANTPEGQPIITWGYHHYFHGKNMSREMLNQISNDRPLVVWHRSFHELYFNDAALKMFGWTEESWSGEGHAYSQLDWDRGHAFEAGGKLILNDVLGYVVDSGMFATGMERTKDYVHSGGITTAIDPGVIATPEMFSQLVSVLEDGHFPMDYWLMPAGNFTYMMANDDPIKGKQLAEQLMQSPDYQGEQIKWLPKFVKLFSDGAMYSQLMQMKDGYIDGHEGEWIQQPEDLKASMRPYWQDDYTIVIHANGDLGFETVVDTLDTLQKENKRTDHRTGFHHLGFTDKEDITTAVELGANFSVNPYYTHILAEQYSKLGVGPERSETMARGRSFIDAGGKLSLHSDAPMAPAQPLGMVWAAVNRIGLSGNTVMGPQERITVDEAMRAITIDAAYTARLEDEIGTIDIGKKANFTVLDANPYKVDPKRINQIKVEATVYQGVPAPIATSNAGLNMTDKNMRVVNMLNRYDSFAHRHNHDHEVCTTSLYIQKVLAEVSLDR